LTSLGDLYRKGAAGIEADPARAFTIFEQALAAGDTAAISRIGAMLLSGEGVTADPERGIAMLEEAAPASPNLYTVLANTFLKGEAVPADGARAAAYFQQAADAGRANALTSLGDLYRKGAAGVEADPARAFTIFEQALAAGDNAARSRLGAMLLNGEGVKANPASGIAVLEEAAITSPNVYLTLATAYRQGKVVPANDEAAVRYWRQAADAGVERGMVEIVAYRATKTSFRDLEADFSGLSATGRADVLTQLRYRAPNAYVYFVQAALSERGMYDGARSGLLTQGTIRAIYAACEAAGTLDQCRMGPMSAAGWRGLRAALFPELT